MRSCSPPSARLVFIQSGWGMARARGEMNASKAYEMRMLSPREATIMAIGLARRMGRKASRSMTRAETVDAAMPATTQTIQGAPV